MNDNFMKRALDDPVFRRHSGLMGRNPTAPAGQRSKAGAVAPWNWLKFDDVPPATVEGAPTSEESNRERNEIMNKYGGSGHAGPEDIIERWNLRATDDA
eukprot:607049-Alexandrium_andersonii.AAC.1